MKILGLSGRNWKCFFAGLILAWISGCAALWTYGGVPVKFTVETSRADVFEHSCFHGETLDFEVTYKSYGKDLYIPTNYEAQIFWQTNGMSAFFWRTNTVTCVSNKMYTTFLPSMDPGMSTVFGFIGVPEEIYRASFVLRFKNSPGAKPKEMEWPYRELDFSKIEVKNAPYYVKSEVDAMITNVNQRLDGKIDAVKSGNWTYMWYKDYKYWYWYYEDSWYVPTENIKDWIVTHPGSAIGVVITNVEQRWDSSGKTKIVTYREGGVTKTVELPLNGATIIPDVANCLRFDGLRSDSYAQSVLFNGNWIRASGGNVVLNESDPTVPNWAKQSKKPVYEEITDGVNTIKADGKKIERIEYEGEGFGEWITSGFVETNLVWQDETTNGAYVTKAGWYGVYVKKAGRFPSLLPLIVEKEENGWKFIVGTIPSQEFDLGNEPWKTNWTFVVNEGSINLDYVKDVLVSTNNLVTIESDPTVPTWAKQPNPPSMVAPVESVNGKTGTVELAASDVGAYSATSGNLLAQQVATQGAHLNAEDAQFVSTNYDSNVHMPEAYVRIKLQQGGTNVWQTIWEEMRRWNAFTGIGFNWQTWGGFHTWSTNMLALIGETSPKEYAFYDGTTGEVAPDGFFWISQPRIAICAGASYQRHLDAGGAVWILESNGLVANLGGTTNGYFRISDEEGNTQFEIIKGDKQTVPAIARSVRSEQVMGVTHWFCEYAVTNALAAPTAKFCRSLSNPTWIADTEASCPCNVTWTPGVNTYTLEFWPKTTEPTMFCKSEYDRGGETRIRQAVPTEMQYIILNGTKYGLTPKTINGELVMGLTTGN